ncbi:MAG TPA: hypothetical protein VGA19_03205, partial [Rhodospirillales bacterium]
GFNAVINTLGTQVAGTHIYLVSGDAASLSATDVASHINTQAGGAFTAESSLDLLLFVVDDGTNAMLFQADVDGTGTNTTIEAGDLTAVASLANTVSTDVDFV